MRHPKVERVAWALVSFALSIAFGTSADAQEQAELAPDHATPKVVSIDGQAIAVDPVATRVEPPPGEGEEDSVAERIAKLAPIPEPPMFDSLDDVVREQYQTLRATIDEFRADPEPKPGPLSWAYGKLGMWAQAYRFYDTALIAFANAELLRRADHRWPYLTAHILRRAGDTAAARAAFARAHRARPDDVPSLVLLAELELEANDLGAAQTHVDAALTLDPQCVLARFIDGRIASERGDYASAIQKILSALRLQRRSSKMHYALGLAYRGAGDLEQAEAALARAAVDKRRVEPRLMRDPVFERMTAFNVGAKNWVRKGRQALTRNDFAMAAEYFGKALAIDPERVALKNQYARALVQGGRYEEGIKVLEEVLAKDPGLQMTRYNLAVALAHQGNHERAEKLLREVTQNDKANAGAHLALARTLSQLGRPKESIPEIEAAIALDPSREMFRLERAVRLIELGRHAEVIAVLELDVKTIPSSAGLQMLLSRLLSSSPDTEARDGARSLALSELANEQKSNLGMAETRAMAFAELGDFEAAIAWQKAAIDGAESAAETDALARAKQRLANYEQGKPCRAPWVEGEQNSQAVRVRPPRG